jgi:hypothetical protein
MSRACGRSSRRLGVAFSQRHRPPPTPTGSGCSRSARRPTTASARQPDTPTSSFRKPPSRSGVPGDGGGGVADAALGAAADNITLDVNNVQHYYRRGDRVVSLRGHGGPGIRSQGSKVPEHRVGRTSEVTAVADRRPPRRPPDSARQSTRGIERQPDRATQHSSQRPVSDLLSLDGGRGGGGGDRRLSLKEKNHGKAPPSDTR